MVPAGHVLAFAAVVAVLIAIPGPSVLFIVGRRAALLAMIGGTGGLVMIGLGVSIAATGRKD